MRALITLAVTAALATSTLVSPAAANGHWPGPNDTITAHATGLFHTSPDGASRVGMPFGSPFHSTMHTLVAVFGPDVTVSFPQECGAGPLVIASFPNQIDLIFQDDRLAGWFLIDDATIQTWTGLQVGSARDALETAGLVSFFESGIGTEFSAGDLFGLMDEDGSGVAAIWSGTTCIFR